jgi:hypothetical protein
MSRDFLLIAEGEHTLGFADLVAQALNHWPGATFLEERDQTKGIWGALIIRQPPRQDLSLFLMSAGSDGSDRGINLDGAVETAAEFLAWLTSRPAFPSDSVVVWDWGPGPARLHPNMTSEKLLDILETYE